MKVGILGSDVVGQTLANGFTKHGYDVMIGTRDILKLKEMERIFTTNYQIQRLSKHLTLLGKS